MYSLTQAYAAFLYHLFIFLAKRIYKPRKAALFSSSKHGRMLKMSAFAAKIFNLMIAGVDETTKHNFTMSVDYQGSILVIRPFIYSEVIMVSGLWEPPVKAFLEEETKKNEVIVDVGANIGVYVIPLARRVGKVIAFEPHPKTHEMLEKSIELNHIHNVKLIRRAIGHSEKKISFHLTDTPMHSSFIPTNNTKIGSVLETESIDLDTALAGEDRVDWLIIDVEGFEAEVLTGAIKTLTEHSPRIIVESLDFDILSTILTNEGYSITNLYSTPYTTYYYAIKKSKKI